MDLVEEFIEEYLEHADPKYYDPVKAHEYYERTKELKGREPAPLKKESQRKAFGYSKVKIAEAKQKELENAAAKTKAAFEKVRQTAELRRKEIREKLDALLEKSSEDIKGEAEAAAAKIRRLPPIPRGLSPSAAAAAHKKRDAEIARIRGDVMKKREAASAEGKNAREVARSEGEKIRTEMKATVNAARANYNALRENLKKKYEKESEQEFEAIRQNV